MAERFDIGDRVEVVSAAVRRCPSRLTFHMSRRTCYVPRREDNLATGVVYAYTAANGGPEAGHGTLVALDCPHKCAVALTHDEMQIA